jgi:serine/threonine protein kinase/tetratricopeptide (TPR) repeat protein
MTEQSRTGKPTQKGWRALYNWLGGRPPADRRGAPDASGIPSRIGQYAILRKLGQGGMGVVYAARDERLERSVALKTMAAVSREETARRRFWREARALASVNHPNVCQIYEVGEDNGELFIAMELLDGEPLSDRLQRGPLAVGDAVPVARGLLTALSALHARGIVHRDVKPSNVFLTSHGVKLLDFGLARPSDPDIALAESATADLTRTGIVVGTPRYMAPEQVTGEALDARTDLFAVGAILFEMLAGRPAFTGQTAVAILHATLYEQPPALSGSPAVAAADRVVRRALAKQPSERPASAEAMADELDAVRETSGSGLPALARPLTRLVVLPFRVLRADPDTDFLAFSVPDAVATSLSGVGSLVVRSSAAAARFNSESPDFKTLATEVDVDLVVTGTLLRSGEQLRVVTQLVEAPAGTLMASHTVQAPLGDLFKLQDDIAHRLVEALSLPLAGRGGPASPNEPRNARAYEFYLRANELARDYSQLPVARDLYLQSVEADPDFAPAWAHLGRCHRVIGKFLDSSDANYARAEHALRRALELSPELPIAHKFYAHLEADTGHAEKALVRLLVEASRRGNDPELFAGLVHACRYCGLFKQSIAAHEEARRLDPHVPTSLEQTLLVIGDMGHLTDLRSMEPATRAIALGLAGRRDEARVALDELLKMAPPASYRSWTVWTEWLAAWVNLRHGDLTAPLENLHALGVLVDPEAIFIQGWMLCEAGLHARGLVLLEQAVAGGYFAAPTLARAHHFDPLRTTPAFVALVQEAERRREAALAAFRTAGGERLLGP